MPEANVSALSALGVARQVSANNIANVNTDGFKSSSVAFESGPEGEGVRVADIRRSTSAGPFIDGAEGSNTDLARETVDMISTGHAFSANATSVRVSEQLTGHLLDMLA